MTDTLAPTPAIETETAPAPATTPATATAPAPAKLVLTPEDTNFAIGTDANAIGAAIGNLAAGIQADRQFSLVPATGLAPTRQTIARVFESEAGIKQAVAVFQIPSLDEYLATEAGRARVASVMAGDALRKASGILNRVLTGAAAIADFPITVADFITTIRSAASGTGRKRFDRQHWIRVRKGLVAKIRASVVGQGKSINITFELLENALSNAAFAAVNYPTIAATFWVSVIDMLIGMEGQIVTDKDGKPLLDDDGETVTCDASLYRSWKATRDAKEIPHGADINMTGFTL